LTRARDVANVLSTATALATDSETAAAISSHATASNGHISYGNTAGRPASPITGQVYSNTQTGFMEVYNGTSWEAIGAVASTVTGVTATNQGSGRAYNNGQSSVAFTPGSVIGSSYTVTSTPGSYIATGSASPLTVTGLQSATEYTYTVVASNRYGTAAASAASAGVTATTVPQAPTIGTATGADQSATLTFTAGANGGSSITNYKYSTDNSTYSAFSPAQTSSPLTISGLTNNQSYSFYLKAVNANGDSAASAASNTVVPVMPGNFESIATATVIASGGSNFVEFTSIPNTYKHLQLRILARGTNANTQMQLAYKFNSDSGSNYTFHLLRGDGSGAFADGAANQGFAGATVRYAAANATSQIFGAGVSDILDYSNTNKYKTVRSIGGTDQNGSGQVYFSSNLWRDTSAISSIYIYNQDGNNIAQYSHFALYGIKGA
jgi:uncharacterized protein YccT (UPF0319 family)